MLLYRTFHLNINVSYSNPLRTSYAHIRSMQTSGINFALFRRFFANYVLACNLPFNSAYHVSCNFFDSFDNAPMGRSTRDNDAALGFWMRQWRKAAVSGYPWPCYGFLGLLKFLCFQTLPNLVNCFLISCFLWSDILRILRRSYYPWKKCIKPKQSKRDREKLQPLFNIPPLNTPWQSSELCALDTLKSWIKEPTGI